MTLDLPSSERLGHLLTTAEMSDRKKVRALEIQGNRIRSERKLAVNSKGSASGQARLVTTGETEHVWAVAAVASEPMAQVWRTPSC